MKKAPPGEQLAKWRLPHNLVLGLLTEQLSQNKDINGVQGKNRTLLRLVSMKKKNLYVDVALHSTIFPQLNCCRLEWHLKKYMQLLTPQTLLTFDVHFLVCTDYSTGIILYRKSAYSSDSLNVIECFVPRHNHRFLTGWVTIHVALLAGSAITEPFTPGWPGQEIRKCSSTQALAYRQGWGWQWVLGKK